MPLKRLIQVPVLFLLIILPLSAQYSPGVNWKKIEKEHILLIFPEELSETALVLADKIDDVYRRESQDFSSGKQTRWPLILTTSGMVSNGYVSMPPRKGVWYGTPAAEGLSTLDWYDLLGLHETRHMVQMDSMNMRFIRFLYYIGGEMAQTGGIHLSVPRWFLEGDAVSAETIYSDSGRGRDPEFYKQLKLMTLDGEYSYQQFVNRSYKTYFPDRYSFGYLMSSFIRKKYGDDSWNQILKTTAAVPLPALGFYLGAKKVTGKSWSLLFLDMMEDLKENWEKELDSQEMREDKLLLNRSPDLYTQYEVLFSDEEGVLARKYSLAEPSYIIRIQDGEEKKVHRLQPFAGVSSNGKELVWTYNRPSMLYESLNWSDLVSYNLETGRKKYLTKKSRSLFPAFSPGGELLVTVFWSEKREGSLRILNSSDGEILKEYNIQEEGFPSYPAWSADEKTIYFLQQNEKGRAVLSLDLESGEFSVLKDYSYETLKRLCSWDHYLLYSSNAGGLENIMALDLENGEEFQLTSRAFGVGFPYISQDEGILYYSDTRGINGSVPVSLELIPESWIPFEKSSEDVEGSFPYLSRGDWSVHALSELEEINESESRGKSEIEDYSLFNSGFNIHSWGISPNLETMTGLRFNLQSANVMGTFNWSVGGEYDINEQTWGAFLDMDWQRFYPVISLRNSADYRIVSETELFDVSSRIMLSFPMNLSRELWSFSLNPAVSTGLRAYLPLNGEDPIHYFPVNTGLFAYALLPGSFRSILPKWGVSERFGSSVYPADPKDYYQYYSHSVFYTPGFFRNTGFSFGFAFEEQSGNYSLSFPFARGYNSSTAYRTVKASGDYDFPIAYPDAAVGSFLYIKRIRGNLFFDYLVQGDLAGDDLMYRSLGTELSFDLTAANQEQGEFNLGFRFLWLLDEKRPAFQLVFMNASTL